MHYDAKTALRMQCILAFILNKLTKNIINMFNTLHVAHDITGHSTIAQKKLHFNVFDFFLC